jgi:hypothetical protein
MQVRESTNRAPRLPEKPSRMTPEDKARNRIDQQLADGGWTVQDFREMNPRHKRRTSIPSTE